MSDNNTIEVYFLHPRDSSLTLTADLSPQCTGREAIQELLRDADGTGPFLQPRPEGQDYILSVRRTQQEIASNMTFAQAGVIDADSIVVVQRAEGAHPTGTEI